MILEFILSSQDYTDLEFAMQERYGLYSWLILIVQVVFNQFICSALRGKL